VSTQEAIDLAMKQISALNVAAENMGFFAGREYECQRIIKVINTAKGSDCGCEYCKEHVAYLDQLIDLIKGEVK